VADAVIVEPVSPCTLEKCRVILPKCRAAVQQTFRTALGMSASISGQFAVQVLMSTLPPEPTLAGQEKRMLRANSGQDRSVAKEKPRGCLRLNFDEVRIADSGVYFYFAAIAARRQIGLYPTPMA
jgi:hypothetical protein